MKFIVNTLEKIPVVNDPKTNFEALIGIVILVSTSLIYLSMLITGTLGIMFSIIFSLSYLIA